MKDQSKANEQKKLVGLIGAIVLVFGFVFFRIVTGLQASPAPPGTQQVAGPVETIGGPGAGSAPGGGTAVAMGAPAGADSAGKDDEFIDVPTFLPSETPNPFHKDNVGDVSAIATPNLIDDTPAPPEPPLPKVRKRPRGKRGLAGGGDELVNPPMSGDVPLPDQKLTQQPIVVKPDVEELQIMGVSIASGQKPFAIIRVDGKDYPVEQGGTFAKGLRVKAISESQVVIDQAGALRILRVGAHSPSQAPANPPSPSTPVPPNSSKPIGSF